MAEKKNIATGYIGNALRSSAADHTTTFADEIFDTERQKYQNEVNADLETKIAEEKAAIMGTDRIADGAVTTEKLADSAIQAIIYDVSAHNDGAVFESLSALLSSSNLSTLIPTSVRHGGMTIRFIQGSEQSSDNKYVQFRYMSSSTAVADITNVANWQGVDDVPTAGSDNLVKSGGVKSQLIDVSDSLSSVKDIYFDVTPEGNAYWSAGGVLTPLNSYRYKSIDVSKIAGKYILVKAGYPGEVGNTEYTHYCYIKKSDNSYQPLTNYVIKKDITPSNCSLIKLPEDAIQLDISWNYGSNVRAIVSFDYQINEILNKPLDEIELRVGGFWDLTTNLQNGYYSKGGVVTPYASYRCKAFSIPTSSEGTTIIIKAGSPNNTLSYCWMKYKDNTYVPLSTICTIVDRYGVLGIDNSMLELEISFDYGSGIIPFISTYLAKEFNEEIIPINPTNINLNVFTLDVTSQYITEENEEVGYYDYKGELHGSDTNWKHVTFNVPAKTYLRFQYYSYQTVGVFIVKYSDGRQKIYADCKVNNRLQDIIFFAEENCVLTWTYSVQRGHIHKIFAAEKSKDITNLQEIIFNKSIQLIYAENPDYVGKYWDADGELQTLNNYRAFEVNISSYIGKNIKIRAGYQISNSTEIVGWCWIKKNDNSVVALSNYIQEFISGECAIVQIPEDTNKLLLSWDKNQYDNNGWSNAYCIYETESVFSKLQDNVETLNNQVESLTEKSLPLDGKKIFLFGDSISSTDYTWYKDYLALYTGATVYNQGASGRDAAYQASNEYFQRLANLPSDVIVVLVGGNDSGASGTIGTFDFNSELGQMGESVVQETDISVDYDGTKFIQAVSHIIRKWRSLYWNFRLTAGLNSNILDTQNDNEVVYPLSGTATESQCISYAQSQGWTLGYGERYVMKTTETDADKRAKLIAVKQPKMFLCTTLPQRRYNSSSYWSNPQNWERKRLACIECAEKYGIPLIDLAKEFAIDWDAEPYWPGQGYNGTSKTDNQGIYTMDGLHPNEFGYAYISQIVSKHLIGDISN